jgi:hypothetical protein
MDESHSSPERCVDERPGPSAGGRLRKTSFDRVRGTLSLDHRTPEEGRSSLIQSKK